MNDIVLNSGFARGAAELRRAELARLSDAIVPRIEALRAMTLPGFRIVIATMLERFGHTIATNPSDHDLITTKGAHKFITACSPPSDPTPTTIMGLRRLHDSVVATNAERGFFITAREFTPEAKYYAESAPIDLFDGKRLIKALNQSRRHVLLPQTYKAMCGQCGEVVCHRLGDDEALPCANGHQVAPTIARATLIPAKPTPAAAMVVASSPRRNLSHRRRGPANKPRVRA